MNSASIRNILMGCREDQERDMRSQGFFWQVAEGFGAFKGVAYSKWS